MSDYQIQFSKQSQKDIAQLTAKQKSKLKEILQQFLQINTYAGKQMKGNLRGFYSYRLNKKDRILYEIIEQDKVVIIIRAKTHYGD